MNDLLRQIGQTLSRIIQREVRMPLPEWCSDSTQLSKTLKPGDVLLVDGTQNVSVAIKYLTQSTWSHAALYVGKSDLVTDAEGRHEALIEVDLQNGCQIVPLSSYSKYNTRICRAHGLSPTHCLQVVQFMHDKIGIKYDLRNIFDLLRYLIPTPPVPVRWRRRMIALGSGDPSKAICSSLIAQAFQSVHYPILPTVQRHDPAANNSSGYSHGEIYHIRHHSLFTPRDFDISPYFSVIKPAIEADFDYQAFVWDEKNEAVEKR